MKKIILSLLFLGIFICSETNLFASPVQWSVNGHWYELITFTGSFTQARTDAMTQEYESMPGYLVTITSQAEEDFIWNTFGEAIEWIGGYQYPLYITPADAGWNWVTGEPFVFEHLDVDDAWGGQYYLHHYGYNNWDDDSNGYRGTYLVEYGEYMDDGLHKTSPLLLPDPTPAVPEPLSCILLGLGLIPLFSKKLKRR